MGDIAKLFLGVVTFGQIPAILFLALTGAEVPNILLPVLAFGELGLWVFYLWDIRQNSRVPKTKERIWWWIIFMFGPLAEPVYFWRFIRGEEPV